MLRIQKDLTAKVCNEGLFFIFNQKCPIVDFVKIGNFRVHFMNFFVTVRAIAHIRHGKWPIGTLKIYLSV